MGIKGGTDAKVDVEEGYVSFLGYRTWYRRATPRGSTKSPVLLIHGGPGSASTSMAILEALTADGFPVVRYDQLGCGRSDRPAQPDLWEASTFYDELDQLRDQLALDQIHLLGHSWGGMLAMVHAAAHPDDVRGVVLSSAPASVPRISRETREMVALLPAEVREVIEQHEAAGTTDDPAYRDAVHEFDRRHICRLEPYPEVLRERADHGHDVYATMCGPSEFNIIGRLKDWDFIGRLHEIRQPTLVTGGRYDEFTPTHAGAMLQRLPAARYVCFEHSAHCTYLEEPDLYRRTVAAFLDEVEGA
jgi:proline-specific peptidase